VDQRRVWLAVGLSLLLLLVWQQFVVAPYRRQAPHPDVPVTVVPPTTPDSQPTEAPPTNVPGSNGLAALPGGTPIVVETDLFRAEMTSTGGRLSSFRLKKFKETVAPDSPPLDLVEKSPVLPLTVPLGPGMTDAAVVYTPDRTSLTLTGDQEGTVVLHGRTPDGRSLEKILEFKGNSYLFNISTKGAVPGLVLSEIAKEGAAGGQQSGREMAIALANQKLVEHATKDFADQPVQLPDASWAGFSAQYFVAIALPANGTTPVILETVATGITDDKNAQEKTPIVRLDSGGSSYRVFMGPKERDVLTAAGHQLDRALDFGWFWFIALPLLYVLKMLHSISGNYGVDIILLTTLVKVVTIPLTQSSLRNMKAMQKLQPEMTRLRERYKDDQGALQKEMMELYKRHQVNPLSGCLPMILQMPIFVGLYNALNHSIELRHAPFMLWINDLSSPDKLPIAGFHVPVLTIVMGLSMLVQQRMTPQQGDPMQQRMMMIMPVMFTFMFINFPAGLVLYWLVNNLLSIAQQYFMLRADQKA
jgi:YidC/Oxa1 family membrane protein insertase